MYTPELSLVKYLCNKEYYNKYIKYIDIKYIKEVYKELFYIYELLNVLISESENSISVAELKAFFFFKYPDVEKQLYSSLFDKIEQEAMSEERAEALLKEMAMKKNAMKLSEHAFKVAQGQADLSTIADFYDDLLSNSKVDHHEGLRLVTTDLEQLLHETYQDQGLRWRLECLNKSLGSLRKGDFGFIFARPETGKTTFLASETTSFLEQTQEPVVWLN